MKIYKPETFDNPLQALNPNPSYGYGFAHSTVSSPQTIESPIYRYVPVSAKKDEINVNLNFFLKMLGATQYIICDDQKTLEFMFEVKKKLEDAGWFPESHPKNHETQE